MKKIILLLALVFALKSSSQVSNMEGAWELQGRKGLLAYTCVVLSDDKRTVKILNSSDYFLIDSVDEEIIIQNNELVLTEYGEDILGYRLVTKTFLLEETLYRVIIRSNDTLRYKKIN
tara:strand:+ start:109 stop:462 length:354 start_codon:yes stop_codon:yes gene_type:complete